MVKNAWHVYNALADGRICNCQADGTIFPPVISLNTTPLSLLTYNVVILRQNDKRFSRFSVLTVTINDVQVTVWIHRFFLLRLGV
jgi:hypothetical protein